MNGPPRRPAAWAPPIEHGMVLITVPGTVVCWRRPGADPDRALVGAGGEELSNSGAFRHISSARRLAEVITIVIVLPWCPAHCRRTAAIRPDTPSWHRATIKDTRGPGEWHHRGSRATVLRGRPGPSSSRGPWRPVLVARHVDDDGILPDHTDRGRGREARRHGEAGDVHGLPSSCSEVGVLQGPRELVGVCHPDPTAQELQRVLG